MDRLLRPARPRSTRSLLGCHGPGRRTAWAGPAGEGQSRHATRLPWSTGTRREHKRGTRLVAAESGLLQDVYACRDFRDGASRDRTGDLLLAKQALSHLSYGPAGGSSLPAVTSAFCPAGGPDREDREGCGRHFDGIGIASCVGVREARESLPLATEGQTHRGRAAGATYLWRLARPPRPRGPVRARSRPRRAARRRRRRARARLPRT